MSVNVTDVDTFTDPVTVAGDGDAATGASLLATAQALSNRCKYMYNRLTRLDGLYEASATRLIDITSIAADPVKWLFAVTYWTSLGNSVSMVTALGSADLPHGATLTGVSLRVTPGAARAGANRVALKLYSVAADGTWAQIGSTAYDDASTNPQSVAITGLSTVIDRSLYSYAMRITSGNTGASAADNVFSASLTRTL